MAKVEFTIYKLHFTSPLHIGDSKNDYSISLKTIESDTIYAALIACLAKLGEIIPQDGDLGFTLSSLFPFYQDNAGAKSILFFPRPLVGTLPVLKDISFAKKTKQVKWLDLHYFQKALKGEQLFASEADFNNVSGEYITIQNEDGFDPGFIYSQVSHRVSVARRYDRDSEPFYMDRLYFKEKSGLYFIANGNLTKLDKALSLLSVEGIGTDRNVGNGFFEYEKDKICIDIPLKSDYLVSLSLFLPNSKEQLEGMLSNSFTAYTLIRRGGWITDSGMNTMRKNAVYAFSNASVFYAPASTGVKEIGRMVDLRPNLEECIEVSHPIWRCGRALFIPINL